MARSTATLTLTDGGFSTFNVDQAPTTATSPSPGRLTLGGDLFLNVAHAMPAQGTSFDIITAENIEGAFQGQYPYQVLHDGFLDDEITATTVRAMVKPSPILTIADPPDVSESDGTATITVERVNPIDRVVFGELRNRRRHSGRRHGLLPEAGLPVLRAG